MSSTAAQLVSNWGSNRLNELRTQYAQRHFHRKSHAGGPEGISVGITNAISFGHPTSDGEDFVQGLTQVLDNFTLIRGRHSFKQGFDFQLVQDTRAVPLTAIYTFPTVAAYLAAKAGTAPFGYTTFAQVIGDPNFKMTSKLFSAFWQDDWRLAENLKVLYGFRYDAYIYPKANPAAPFSYDQKYANDTNNFGPRVGIAWTLGAKKDQVVRASTGIMYDQPLLAVYENAIQTNGLPARQTFSVAGTGIGAPAFPNTLSNLPAGAVLPVQSIFAPDPNLKLAYNIQNSAQYARGFGRSFNGSIGVVYNRGYNLPVITDVNLINPTGTLADGRPIYSHGGQRRDPHGSALQSHHRGAVPRRVDLQGADADVRQALVRRRSVRPELHARQGDRHRAPGGRHPVGAGRSAALGSVEPRARQGTERARHAPLAQRQHRGDVALQSREHRAAEDPQ